MILIDTDVLIDAATDRHPYADAAEELLKSIERGVEEANVSWHTISNLYYVARPLIGSVRAKAFILQLLRIAPVAQTGTEDIRYAARLSMTDFEDAMQVAAARACGATRIVTRNVSDYARSPIPAVTPQEALAHMA